MVIKMIKFKTIQVRIPLALHRDILKIKREMERLRKKPVTFSSAANEFHRRRFSSGGKLI